jgi:ADP-dependent phosphofructokinase/glucokinase
MNERIALGFGNNIDYEIVWSSRILEELIIRYDIGEDELHVDRAIHCERDLVISILSFLKAGFGGERFVSAKGVIEHFSRRFEKKITLGGTSVRAAIAMRKLGYTSALHLVTINDDVRRLIPQDCSYVCSNAENSSHPHLIVQFERDTHVRAGHIDLHAVQADRLIYHNDTDNITMKLNEDFSKLISESEVLLVSGFNAMQNEALLTDRLQTVLRMIACLPEDAQIFCEDAGFYDASFSKLMFRSLEGKIHIFSLNEDELQAHLDRSLDLLDAFHIEKALLELQKLIPVPVIVVHSKYWALAYGENATSFSEALKGGITMATTRFCYGDDVTLERYQEIGSLPPNEEGAILADTINRLLGNKICCVPVAQVEQSNTTAVGLGDAFVGGFLPALLSRY